MSVEWNGVGLPPVGCECEWQDRNTKQWAKVSIVYASEWVTVIREDKIADPVEIAIENYGDEERKKFRPVRTKEEIKREEGIDGIVQFFINYHGYPKGAEQYLRVATALYDAAVTGKIPHITLK